MTHGHYHVKVVLFELHGLRVYYTAPDFHTHYRLGSDPVYWMDAESPDGRGPFPTLQMAMNDYSNTISNRKAEKAKLILLSTCKESPVISVNFKTKKRIT